MGTKARLAGVAVLVAALTAAVPATAASAHDPLAGTVFVQTDNTAGNAVVAYDRQANGALKLAGTYATGGLGGQLTGSVVDHLASQGSLAYDKAHGKLYVTNAGSDTITAFDVHGDRLTGRHVYSAGGSFPVSITVHDNLVYVLNARDGGSVQGFWRIGGTLVKIPGSHRALGLDPTATPEFTHTPGQVAFTPDGSQLVVTTKGNTSAIDVFAVDRIGLLSATPVSTVEDGAVPFAVSFDRRGHLVVAEAGTNAIATFSIARDGRVTQLSQALTGQAATCWIAGDGTVFYTSNAGSGTVSGYRVTGGGGLTALGNTATDGGTVDAAETGDGAYLYVQTGATGVVDGYRVNHDGSLTKVTSVTVAGAVGGEGIAAS